MLTYVILGFLSEKPLTGYEIKQFMIHSTSNFIDASFGSIYPTLSKLTTNGFISCDENVEGGKFKKRYLLTEKGREELLRWLRKPCVFSPFNYEYLAKMFFYQLLPQKEVIHLIKEFQKTVSVEIQKLEQLEDHCKDFVGFYQYATLRFGKECYRLVLDFHSKLIDEIKKENKV
jgi:DNA-binding PadR family transcriptional regulator